MFVSRAAAAANVADGAANPERWRAPPLRSSTYERLRLILELSIRRLSAVTNLSVRDRRGRAVGRSQR